MGRSKEEDAGGLTPVKDGNAAARHFDRRTLLVFKCVGYTTDIYSHVIESADQKSADILADIFLKKK